MIKIDSVDVWEIFECYDRDYRRIAYFKNESDAKKLKQKSNWYGCNRSSTPQIIIYDNFEEYTENHEKIKKLQKALNKLTDEEKLLLGLK